MCRAYNVEITFFSTHYKVHNHQMPIVGKYGDYDATDNSCCLPFWQVNKQMLNLLLEPVLRALSVPASSAPVERIFSHG